MDKNWTLDIVCRTTQRKTFFKALHGGSQNPKEKWFSDYLGVRMVPTLHFLLDWKMGLFLPTLFLLLKIWFLLVKIDFKKFNCSLSLNEKQFRVFFCSISSLACHCMSRLVGNDDLLCYRLKRILEFFFLRMKGFV